LSTEETVVAFTAATSCTIKVLDEDAHKTELTINTQWSLLRIAAIVGGAEEFDQREMDGDDDEFNAMIHAMVGEHESVTAPLLASLLASPDKQADEEELDDASGLRGISEHVMGQETAFDELDEECPLTYAPKLLEVLNIEFLDEKVVIVSKSESPAWPNWMDVRISWRTKRRTSLLSST
jgi:hypothetical protein